MVRTDYIYIYMARNKKRHVTTIHSAHLLCTVSACGHRWEKRKLLNMRSVAAAGLSLTMEQICL